LALRSLVQALDAAVVAAGIDPQGSLEDWADNVPEEALPFDYVVTRGKVGLLNELKGQASRKRVFVDRVWCRVG
jgi:chromosome partitioning protein